MRKAIGIAGGAAAALVVLAVVAVVVLATLGKQKLHLENIPGPAVTASKDPAVIERGRVLSNTVAHCSQCHGIPDRAHPEHNVPDGPLAGGMAFEMGPLGSFYASNLTPDAETGIGKRTDEELARTITTGVLPDGRLSIFMRYSAANLSQQDLTAVISYLRSRPPVRHAVPPGALSSLGYALLGLTGISPDLTPLPAHVEAAASPTVERGQYLAEHVSLCTTCHSAMDPMTFQPVGALAGGGNPEQSHGKDEDMEFVAPNLTAHPTGVTGKLSEEEFLARFKAGRAQPSSIMPWENLSRMAEKDLRSIYRYLRSLPPVNNDVGPTYRAVGWKPPR
jgi:mono/diheme cytochrome c family protein